MTRRLVVVALAVAAWSASGIGVRATYGARTTADEPQYLLTALSLAEDRSLDVSDERIEQRYRPFHEALLPVQTRRQADGSRVSPHDPLLPAVLAVPMGLGGWVVAKLTLAALAGVLAAATLWTAVRRFAVPVPVATLTVLAFALAPPFAVYGTQVYPEMPAALVVVAGIACLTGRLGRGGTAGAVAAVIALPWLAVKYLPIAAVLAVALAARLWRRAAPGDRRRLLWALAGLAVGGSTYFAAHQAWYGGWTVYAAGDHFVGGELTAVGNHPHLVGRSVRLVGLLVDRNFGLAAWQPLFLVVPLALGAVARLRPPGWGLLTALVAAGWLNATFVALTMHGYWWPGRQTIVVLPAVVLAVAWWAARSSAARRVLAAGLALGAASYAWVVGEGWAHRLTWVVDFSTTTNPMVRGVRVFLPDYQRHSSADWALHGLWACAVVALLWFGFRQTQARKVLRTTEQDVLGSPYQRPVERGRA